MIRMLDRVLRQEGAKALVKGISATYYGSIFYGALYFHLYPYLKERGHN